MKKLTYLNLLGTALISTVLLTACGGDSTDDVIADVIDTGTVTSELSAAEIDGLLYMREEEELARDLYLDIYAAKDDRLTVFKKISDNSETQHAEAMKVLLDTYGLADPSTGQHNTYTNANLQDLYDLLINIGLGSDDLAALRVGALVEETDILDIELDLESVSAEHQDIIATYDYLLCGSRNHLRAFVEQIELITGTPYQTQIPEMDEEVQSIINSTKEQCGM